MKKKGVNILLVAAFFVGLSLLLYPTIADCWNSFHQTTAIGSYVEEVSNMDDDTYREIWNSAHAYNKALAKRGILHQMDAAELDAYEKELNVSDTGILGYIDIPVIDCRLPIYRGTDEGVLQVAVGHLPDTSLPVGGPSTHCVLSGHRGLPSARLFTDLDQLSVGDTFMLQTMDETLTYQVEKILIVKPYEIDSMKIEEGRDLCTLVTCTPYGINSHRLLVQGFRIATTEQPANVRVSADASQVEPFLVAVILGSFFLGVLWILLLIVTGTKKREKKHE